MSSNPEKSDEHERRGGRNFVRWFRPTASYTTLWDVTLIRWTTGSPRVDRVRDDHEMSDESVRTSEIPQRLASIDAEGIVLSPADIARDASIA